MSGMAMSNSITSQMVAGRMLKVGVKWQPTQACFTCKIAANALASIYAPFNIACNKVACNK